MKKYLFILLCIFIESVIIGCCPDEEQDKLLSLEFMNLSKEIDQGYKELKLKIINKSQNDYNIELMKDTSNVVIKCKDEQSGKIIYWKPATSKNNSTIIQKTIKANSNIIIIEQYIINSEPGIYLVSAMVSLSGKKIISSSTYKIKLNKRKEKLNSKK